MNSSLYIAQANADLRKPHPLSNDPFFGHYAPHEAAQELVRALKGGRKANPSGAGKALRAAHKLTVRLQALMARFDEALPQVDPEASFSVKLGSALPDMMADAGKDARDVAKLLRFSTGAITFAANRIEASRIVQRLRGKLECILYVHLSRPVCAGSMSVDEMIAMSGGKVVAHPRLSGGSRA